MSIERIHTSERMSQIVVYGDTVYLAGQVASGAPNESVATQTKDILNKIDGYLAEAGTDKSKLLSATIWIADMSNFAEMNSIWDSWVSPGKTPCRACVEAKLASDSYSVEIMVTAAR